MSNFLFWISLASALVVFAGITFFKFSHGATKAESPDAPDLPEDRPQTP